jgi:hypothetical protein
MEVWEGKPDPRADTVKSAGTGIAVDKRAIIWPADAGPGAVMEVDSLEGMVIMPSNAEARKEVPIYSGVLRYFPLAIAEVAKCSFRGNEQHNPGTTLHWDRAKSGDELDALARHLMEAGTKDKDGVRHSTKVAWRALANLQKELEDART